MNKPIQFLLCLLLTLPAFGQKVDMELFKNYKARNIGPAGMSGRVTAIDAVHTDPDVIYVGTASGGLWKSENGGVAWTPIFEKEATASIGAVAIQQSNPSVVWVGTGEGNPRNSLNGGYGIYKSLDGGKNWKLMGLEKTRHIHRVVIDPTNPDVVYVAAIGSPWGEHPERGVYKTTDGGQTWNKILFVNNKTGAAELVIDPTNPNKLIAAMWEHKREPWFFNSGGPGSGLYVTHDGGKNWEKRTDEDGLPKGDLGRIGIAIAASNPKIVYALVEAKKNALYKSEDGGFKWEIINDKEEIGDRPFYYSDLFVNPKSENIVYSVFTFVNVSEDGGKSFKALMPAYGVNNGIHPDHHAWYMNPINPDIMMDGNDGGFNMTRDGGKTWRFIENLPLAQFYHINVDNELPYNVYGGLQDNGSWGGPAYVWKAQSIRNSYWQELAFGDGFDVVPDPDDSRYGYAMSQQGNVVRYDRETGYSEFLKPTHPDPEMFLRFNWNSGIGQDPFDSNTIYFGSQFVHKSTDKGKTWTVISPDLTTNDPAKQKQSESGGLTMDATGAENHTTILVIEPSKAQRGVIWVGTDDGNVQITQDGGNTWTNVAKNNKGLPAGSWIPQIKASAKNAGEALLVANDYRRFNYTAYAYRTKDFGKTWTRIADDSQIKSFVLSIVEDTENPNLMFLGADDGLYVSFDAGKIWNKWTAGYPTVSTKDLVIHPREHDLVIGTFGRAVYILDDIRPLRAMASNSAVLNQNLKAFPVPTAYLATYQQPTGLRFPGDAEFQGENRPSGAMISYFFKKKQDAASDDKNAEGDKKPKKDSIQVDIFDGDRLIRTLKSPVPKEDGLHRIYWGLNEKSSGRPSRNLRKNNREFGGLDVLPGTYKIKISYGEFFDETTVKVEADPRLGLTFNDLKSKYDAAKQLESYMELAADAAKQLAESKQTAEDLQKDLTKADKEKYKDQIKATKDIVKKITEVQDLYFAKEDKRQGIVRSPEPNVTNRLSTANRYINSRRGAITATEQRLIDHAKAELDKAIEKTNAFFQTDWANFKTSIESQIPSPFKETKIFNSK
jgi:photosystem II stability/assembly factor-like uncharacterized protein